VSTSHPVYTAVTRNHSLLNFILVRLKSVDITHGHITAKTGHRHLAGRSHMARLDVIISDQEILDQFHIIAQIRTIFPDGMDDVVNDRKILIINRVNESHNTNSPFNNVAAEVSAFVHRGWPRNLKTTVSHRTVDRQIGFAGRRAGGSQSSPDWIRVNRVANFADFIVCSPLADIFIGLHLLIRKTGRKTATLE
jgi:hypothetical protein